jgi:hypothetical protein
MDFIDWCIAKEKASGFLSGAGEEQWVIQNYEKARDRMKKKYGAANVSTNSASPPL